MIRSPRERYRVQYYPVGESMTEQGHAESCDINNIIRRHTRSGAIPPPDDAPIYADVTQLQGELGERLSWANELQLRVEEFARSYEAAASSVEAVPPPVDPPAT